MPNYLSKFTSVRSNCVVFRRSSRTTPVWVSISSSASGGSVGRGGSGRFSELSRPFLASVTAFFDAAVGSGGFTVLRDFEAGFRATGDFVVGVLGPAGWATGDGRVWVAAISLTTIKPGAGVWSP